MKTSRLLALPAIAGAALLTMTGCFQLPGAPTTNPGTSTAPTDGGGGGGEAAVDLAGTTWSGTDSIGNEMTFTFADDGTIDFSDFNTQTYDVPTDTWSMDGSNVEITISGVPTSADGSGTDITYSGQATTGSMSLSGTGEDGESYSLSITEG
ncbi:hypothetical protein GCM10009846_21410 [Agrococcus versicolor]|uniref:Lipoprotein n=1 Tax=Agrococcus versicolor TaxID=501482 RepID=A0ABP5MJ23_9MICO